MCLFGSPIPLYLWSSIGFSNDLKIFLSRMRENRVFLFRSGIKASPLYHSLIQGQRTLGGLWISVSPSWSGEESCVFGDGGDSVTSWFLIVVLCWWRPTQEWLLGFFWMLDSFGCWIRRNVILWIDVMWALFNPKQPFSQQLWNMLLHQIVNTI